MATSDQDHSRGERRKLTRKMYDATHREQSAQHPTRARFVVIFASALAYAADEPLPELSEGPAVVFQTVSIAGSLTYSWSLVPLGGLRVWFD